MADICVASITRNGRTIYAADYGYKCFPIRGVAKMPKKGKRPNPTKSKGVHPKQKS